MADRGVHVYHHHIHETIGSDNGNELSSRLSQVESQISKIMSTLEKSIGSTNELMNSFKTIPTATEAIAVAANKIVAGTKVTHDSTIAEKNRTIQYSKQANAAVGQVDALQRTWGSNLTPEQSRIMQLRNVVNSHIDAAGNFTSNTKEATQSLSQLNQSLQNLNKTVSPTSSGKGKGGLNAFNIVEALTYATVLSAGKYANLGATYDIGIQGASANQLGMMTIQRDIAQRNAIASGVSTGGAATGAVIGGIIGGGPLGGIVGSAIGASLGVIASGITASMNAHETQAYNMQTASNTANLFGGQGGGKYVVNPKATNWDKFKYYALDPFIYPNSRSVGGDYGLSYTVSNRAVADYLNKGQGYNAITSAGLQASGGALYGVTGAKADYLTKTLGKMVANNPSLDITSMLSTINYLAKLTPGNSLADNLYNRNTKKSPLLAFTGGDLGGFLANVANLSQRTPMSVGDAFNYEASVTPYGPAYTSAANSLQTMPVFSQLQAAAILSITQKPGVTLSQIKKNPSLLRSTANHMYIDMFGERFDMDEGLRQSTALGASNVQAIDNSKITQTPEVNAPSALSTPDAVQAGIKAAGGNNNSQHVVIQAQNVSIISSGLDKNGNSPGAMQNLQASLDQLSRHHGVQ